MAKTRILNNHPDSYRDNTQFSMKRTLIIILTFFSGILAKGQDIKSVKITEVEKMIAESKGPLIVNMWATWCKPCIEEIPYFISEVNKQNASSTSAADSIHLLLVSLDFKEAFPKGIAAFAKKRKFTATIVWLDETNADYFCPRIDPKWSGAIPASLFINNKTGYRKFAEDQLSQEELKKEITNLIK